MWKAVKKLTTYMKENREREEAIVAACTAIDAARLAGASDTDAEIAGEAAAEAYYKQSGRQVRTIPGPPISEYQRNLTLGAIAEAAEDLFKRKPYIRDDPIKGTVAIRQIADDMHQRFRCVVVEFPPRP